MTRVLFVSAEAGLVGGGEWFLRDAIDGLAGRCVPACVVPGEGTLADCLRKAAVPVFVAPTGWPGKARAWLGNRLGVAQLVRLVRPFAPDVVYANGGHTINRAVRLADALHCGCVGHVHDFFAPVRRDKYALSRPQVLLACSHGVAALTASFRPDTRVVYNGVDTRRFRSGTGDRPRFGIPEGALAIGFAGTLVAKKGPEVFVEAAARIAVDVPEAVFVMAGLPKPGDEGYLGRLKTRVEALGLAGRFRWPGFVADWERLAAALDVFLFPARDEAFGRVIIEAMASGVAVVTGSGSGPQEIIEDGRTGYVCRHDDIEALTRRVRELAAEPQRRARMGQAAREAVVQRFSREAMLDGVARAIDDARKG